MKSLKILIIILFGSICAASCEIGATEIQYDLKTKEITVLSENYHLKNILIQEEINGVINKSISTSIDFDKPEKSANLLDLEGHGQLYGKPMEEFLERPNLLYTIVVEHDDPKSQEIPLDLIYFTSEELKPGKQVFSSRARHPNKD